MIILGATIASCQDRASRQQTSTSNQADCRTVEHEAGQTQICGQPERIVVLGPYILESLLALDEQPVAYADYYAFHPKDYDNPSQQISYLGHLIKESIANVGTAEKPSLEAIIKVEPDLIIGSTANKSQYETLSQIAPTILFERKTPETTLRGVAQAVNRSEQAEQLLTETKQRMTAARKSFAPIVKAHPQLLLLSSSKLQRIDLITSYFNCASVIEDLGFQLVSPPEIKDSQTSRLHPISIEILPELNNADSVILLGYNFSELEATDNFNAHQLSKLKQAWSNNAIAQSLDASKAGRVYFIPTYICAGLPGAIGTKLYLEELEQQLLPP
ncbi:iron-siderophore ABC transporter substrate-binding protein [Hyella patelloides]|uniref:ABC transporter substrate-binding protein n=1 Tax=Hyella patelloides TaxID=1982969 RepID=UPI001C938514|nr:iron-siderophore ABC transporter substrate-binding protein [Hyella patelloides]